MNSTQENRSKFSFKARIITKYSLKRFLSICGEKMSKDFFKSCELITNLMLGQINRAVYTRKNKTRTFRINGTVRVLFKTRLIFPRLNGPVVSNLTNVHKLNSRINYA